MNGAITNRTMGNKQQNVLYYLLAAALLLTMPANGVQAQYKGLAPEAAEEDVPEACGRSDFEEVVEESVKALRELSHENRPLFQMKLRELKDKHGWQHDQFMEQAAPFVKDDTTAVFDKTTSELLSAITQLGREGAEAKKADCALLLALRARMRLLVETQKSKWSYMFDKINTELEKN